MKKKDIWILLSVLLFLILFVIGVILIDRHREKNVNSFTFPETLVVTNYTEHKRADTLAMIILNKIWVYDTIDLYLYYMHKEMKNDEFEIAAFIQKNPMPHSYSVFLKKNASKNQIMRFMSHELIHLDQMEKEELIQIIGNYEYQIFKGDTIRFSEVKYDDRPFEIDAYSREKAIQKQLFTLLYKN